MVAGCWEGFLPFFLCVTEQPNNLTTTNPHLISAPDLSRIPSRPWRSLREDCFDPAEGGTSAPWNAGQAKSGYYTLVDGCSLMGHLSRRRRHVVAVVRSGNGRGERVEVIPRTRGLIAPTHSPVTQYQPLTNPPPRTLCSLREPLSSWDKRECCSNYFMPPNNQQHNNPATLSLLRPPSPPTSDLCAIRPRGLFSYRVRQA